jgi:hypothetical protein
MPRYARVIFPRDPANTQLLFSHDVVRAIDASPMLQPRVTTPSVTVDVEMLEAEQLPDASAEIASRAIKKLQQAGAFAVIG